MISIIWNYWPLLLLRWGNLVAPQLTCVPVNEEIFFQQDGATSHTARDSIRVVGNLFCKHVISRYGDIPWPVRSPDLSACDFFLKSKDFSAPAPHTVQILQRVMREKLTESLC